MDKKENKKQGYNDPCWDKEQWKTINGEMYFYKIIGSKDNHRRFREYKIIVRFGQIRRGLSNRERFYRPDKDHKARHRVHKIQQTQWVHG